MKFEKVAKIDTYRFHISDDIYCQCEIDFTGNDVEVEAQYTIVCDDTGLREQMEFKNYDREYILSDLKNIIEIDINKILSDISIWNDLIPLIFPNRKDYHLFAAKYEATFLKEENF